MNMAEQTLILGTDNHLVATFTPAAHPASEPPRCIAILSNSGVIPRGGPHRINVHLARRFAALGVPSVRFDMSGLGDSLRASGNLPVIDQWVADTRAVMDAAQSRYGCDRFIMIGFCSGAVVGHLVALQDRRMRGVLLWDLYAYPTLEFHLRTFLYKLRRAGPIGVVKKVFQRLASGFRSEPPSQVESARWVGMSTSPPLDDFVQRAQTLTADGVELFFVFSGGEPEWFNHKGQFKTMFGRFPFYEKVAFNHLEVSDHLITSRKAQLAFLDMTEHWLRQRILKQ
jgi:pimeloyl-ACP methyl ester carboxylesterase